MTEAQTTTLRADRKKDSKAKSIIYQGLDEPTFELMASSKSSKEVWDALHKTYKGADKVKMIRLQTLRGEFESLRMKSNESIAEFYTRVMVVANQLRRNGETLEDMRISEKILRSLDPKFDFIVVALEETKDLETMSVEELVGSLQAHEQKVTRRSDDRVLEQALHSKLSLYEKDMSEGGPHNKEENEVVDLVEEVLEMLKPKVEAEEEETQVEEDVDNKTMSHEDEDEEEDAVITTVQTLTKETFNAIIATNMGTIATSAEVSQMK
ncbi:hypothetical protein LWI28_004122 [Acer negundo]|uniref:Uncharacterized protein n=1 Tax=Acer negundo TaxID=4023 RepID=A0AAD5NJI7_ACENE|nr:hypothetical protein LWI28_004122 [Acer negundo]